MKKKGANAMGKRIRAARLKAGLTQAEAASKAKLSEAYWSQLEIGFRSPSLKSLAKIAKALGKKIDDFSP